jgi:hypothetical protein
MENVCVWDIKAYESGYDPNSLAIFHNVEQQQSFLCAKVLESDNCEIITHQIKQKAAQVHSKTLSESLQHNYYDYVTLFDSYLTNKPTLIKSLLYHRCYLKERGKLLTLIQTQDNGLGPEIKAFKSLYPEIYQSMLPEYQRNISKEDAPENIDFKNMFYSKQELQKKIADIGYRIASYRIKKYKIVIKNIFLYRQYLTQTVFPQFTASFALPENAALELQKKFAQLVETASPKNKDENLIHSMDVTEILFEKYSPFEIKIRKRIEGEWQEI